jgi:hypothetical protein
MKLENLNLGKSLSRDEQKKIRGGEGPCAVGSGTTDCICIGGAKPCVPGNGSSTPWQACNAFCENIPGQYGAVSAGTCIVGACQP